MVFSGKYSDWLISYNLLSWVGYQVRLLLMALFISVWECRAFLCFWSFFQTFRRLGVILQSNWSTVRIVAKNKYNKKKIEVNEEIINEILWYYFQILFLSFSFIFVYDLILKFNLILWLSQVWHHQRILYLIIVN